jgi:hypothetical protein
MRHTGFSDDAMAAFRCCKLAAAADEWLARPVGAVRGLGGGAEFAEGHQAGPAKVAAKRTGRMPMLPRAKRLKG